MEKKMLNVKSVIGACVFALLLTEVASWTIDLPIARKYYFERSKQKHGDENRIYFNRTPNLFPYDNIEGDSLHNTPERKYEHQNYANDYGYLSYMEKKVHGIFSKGDHYLEGLRQAMLRYSQQLENCTRLDTSRPQTNSTWLSEPSFPLNPTEASVASCERATRDSEHVRRLAQLVLWATNELQDIAYSNDYDKKTKESEEYVLLLQLAWALDELARRTGFEPDPKPYATEPTPAPAPTTTPATYFNLPIPNDGPTNADCIKQPSPLPATVRCAVPVPAAVLQLLNRTDSSSPGNASLVQEMARMNNLTNSSSVNGVMAGGPSSSSVSAAEAQRLPGCLSGAQSGACAGVAALLQLLNNGQLQNIQPRPNREADASPLELLLEAEQNTVIPLRKTRTKRSTDNPLKEFALYYGKYKAWTNSNPATQSVSGKADSYDVKNHLTAVKTVRKRAIASDGVKVRIPEDPMQDTSSFVKHQPNVYYVTDRTQANEIKSYLDKIHHKDVETIKDHYKKLNAAVSSVHKRSVYYHKLHRPRVPEDPMQDISYYAKSKPGTNIRPDVANGALVRLGLQQILQRGNIEVARRYGSDYVPGVRPVMAGAIESFTDI